jgi:hypothetical protein
MQNIGTALGTTFNNVSTCIENSGC